MKNLIKKIKGTYAKDILTAFSGTTIGQLIPILLAPVITRIYTPTDFGLLGVYMGIAAIFTLFSTFQYSQAILLSKTKEEEDNLVALSLGICVGLTLLSTIIIMLLKEKIALLLNVEEVENWLLAVPVAILFSGLITTYTKKLNKYRKYKVISISQMMIAIVTVSVSISVGHFFKIGVGLLIAMIAGQSAGIVVLLIGAREYPFEKKNVAITDIKMEFIKHKQFPIFSLPVGFLYNWTTQLPIYILSIYFSPALVGLFNYGRRMTTLPVDFITKSIGLVFAQRAAEEFNKTGNCVNVYKNTLKMLVLILALPFIVLTFFGPFIFGFIFGDEWRGAGEYVQILSIMFYFRAIANPLSYVFIIRNKQNEDFILHIIILVLVSFALYFGYQLYHDIKIMLLFYAIAYTIVYLFYIFRSYFLAKNKKGIR